MVGDNKHARWWGWGREQQPVLQPVAATTVCGVFIALILIMGLMDIRRMERALVGFLENRGINIVAVLQGLAQENLDNLVRASKIQEERPKSTYPSEEFSPQKQLISALVEVGKEVDNHWHADELSEEYLRKFAEDKHIMYIGVLDRKERLVFQNRPLPPEYLFTDKSKPGKQRAVTIDLFTQLGELKKIGFLAMKRRDGSGTIIIALDPEGLRYWGIKVAVEKAIHELGGAQGQELLYLIVEDRRGWSLGAAGVIPEKWKGSEIRIGDILAGRLKWDSRKVVYQGKEVLDMAVPLYLNKKIAGYVRIGLDRSRAEAILAENRRNVVVFIALTIIITLLAMWLLYTNQNRHLARVVQMERRLEKAERLSSLGKLAAGVAHEIRNPLNAISMAFQRLMRECVPTDGQKKEEFEALTKVIRDEIRRLNGIIEEFLTFSRSRRLTLAPYPIEDVLQKLIDLIDEEATAAGITIECQWGMGTTVIPMDVDKLQQALLNLVKNAMESIIDGGKITVSLDSTHRHWVAIRIADTGCGMAEEEIEKIFDPEYTTKEKGLGLGLSLTHEIIRGHNGEIKVTSNKGSGTLFEVILPRETRARLQTAGNGR